MTLYDSRLDDYLACHVHSDSEHGGDDHMDPLSFEGICGSFLVLVTREL